MGRFKHKNKRYIIKTFNYDLEYYVTKYRGYIIIYFNKDLDNKQKSKLLHKIVKKS
jgi:hypothetical protein